MSNTLQTAEIHVAPHGDDRHPGSREQPLRTLGNALERVKGRGAGTTIRLAPGEYVTVAGIELGSAHAGAAGAPLCICGDTPHAARITGALRVGGFAPISAEEAAPLLDPEARRRVWVADLAAQGLPPLAGMPDRYNAPGLEEVFFDGRPMQSARWPNEGFCVFTDVVDTGADDPKHWASRDIHRPGIFRFPNDRPRHWDFARGVYLHGFWAYKWAEETLRAERYDPGTSHLHFAVPHQWGLGMPKLRYPPDTPRTAEEHDFYAIHVFEELDRPGEYYLDRRRQKLYFWPPGDLDKTPVYLSYCRAPLLRAADTAHVVVRDLVFENGCGKAIELRNCTGVRVENCRIRNVGMTGVDAVGGSDNHILRCEISDTGKAAVTLTAGDRKTLANGNCSVAGNHLHDLGRYDWQHGRGVLLGGCGNRVAHNHIHHCPTGGVAYSGNEHVLELNEIHHTCLYFGDVGVFYSGRDWASRGNIVRWNYIHATVNRNEGLITESRAFYLDDCDCGDSIVGNIVLGGPGVGVIVAGGRDHLVQGNVFVAVPAGLSIGSQGAYCVVFDDPDPTWSPGSQADARSWNLLAKCEALDYRSPPWRDRYPRLARIMEEDPLLPLGNACRGNLFIGCRNPVLMYGDFQENWLETADNHIRSLEAYPFIGDPAERLELATLPQLWAGVAGFEPIPVERIGPAGMA